MKKNIFMISCLFFVCCTSLSSCFIDRWVSEALRGEEPVSDQFHEDTGDSIELLNRAFNKTTDEDEPIVSYTPQSVEGCDVVTINQNINDLDYNEGCTPSVGEIRALVIPVDFVDYPAATIENISLDPEWESVSSFYERSSYGKLKMTFDVMDWYTCSQASTYYENLKTSRYGGEVPGVSAIIDEVMKYYRTRIDFSRYDSNHDHIIDALYIIYSHDIDYTDGDFWWAYQYYTFEQTSYGGYTTYPYVFAGYDFLFEDEMNCNTHTYIHETAHLFGIEDYYDADYSSGKTTGGFGGADLMDCTIGDHNAFTKMALGWIDQVLFIDTDLSVTISLPALQDAPSLVILSNNFDKSKGMFQSSSYYILEYYTPSKLQSFDTIFQESGLRLLRVNAMLTNYTESGFTYTYFRYNNSTTSANLIDVIRADGTEYPTRKYNMTTMPTNENDLFHEGDRSPKQIRNGLKSETLPYQFTIQQLFDDKATITFTSN